MISQLGILPTVRASWQKVKFRTQVGFLRLLRELPGLFLDWKHIVSHGGLLLAFPKCATLQKTPRLGLVEVDQLAHAGGWSTFG